MVWLHVLVNRTLDEYTIQYRMLVAKLPATDDAVMLGGDINVVALGWSNSEEGYSVSLGSSSKRRGLKVALAARRLELLNQVNAGVKTHILVDWICLILRLEAV